MGVASDNWFDRVLLPILYVLKTLAVTDAQTPSSQVDIVDVGPVGAPQNECGTFLRTSAHRDF